MRLRHGLVGFLTSLPAHGDLVRVRLGSLRGYVVCHPELVAEVLRDDRTYDKGGPLFDKAREVVGNGLVTCGHQEHRRQRRLVQPAFHRPRVDDYRRSMTEQVEGVLSEWRTGQVIDVPEQTHRLTSGNPGIASIDWWWRV
ncbi:cytochrome P450 [Allokutzneria sp. A3M-2-11 16]|uniref:cytochrome P450 n=1 Tax=Allokutzneria sp. A3M-2-11 16 TaxID=2962043 RepID=UPI0020B6E8AC|nr:cytochrome P450 [Allokutzneria sp. A3M-2-11 16]MCP3798416.1 cytochrome P450 [Allokutzneria sp. A3M-2-11 16]